MTIVAGGSNVFPLGRDPPGIVDPPLGIVEGTVIGGSVVDGMVLSGTVFCGIVLCGIVDESDPDIGSPGATSGLDGAYVGV